MVATAIPVKKLVNRNFFRTLSFNSFFKIVLTICQIFCAAPLLNCKRHFLIILHFAWCTFIVLFVAIASWSMEEILEVNMTTIKKTLYLSEYFSDAGLIVLIILTSYYNRNCYTTFPKRVQELDRRTQIYQLKSVHQQNTHRMHKKIITVFVIGTLFLTSVLFIDFFYNTENIYLFFRSTIVYVLPNITIILWIGQYWALLTLILNQYVAINSILEGLNNPKNQQSTLNFLFVEIMKGYEKPRWDVPAVLDDLRSIFAHLEVLVGDVTSVFGLTITANFLSSFLTLSVQFFVLYKMPDKPELCTWSSLLYALLWITLHCLKFFVILHTNSYLLNVKSEMGIILNCFEGTDTKTEDTINRFLMQLVVRNNVQMACGIVELDMELVGGIISALSIYVIFLIQIDIGEIVLIPKASNNTTTPKPLTTI